MFSALSGVGVECCLLLISHVCLAGAFCLMAVYLDGRYPMEGRETSDWVLLAMGLWPTTCFFRMVYTEALFLLLLLFVMWAINRRRPCIVIAAAVGLATSCRPTGVALLGPFALYLWQTRKSMIGFVRNSALLLPVGCSGILAYMTFQYFAFGDALAFVKTQDHWAVRQPSSLIGYVTALVTLEPIWSKYHPGSVGYWARHEPNANPLFSLEFANPIYFVLAVGFVVMGAKK
jgi:Gpi18-like mannosyltransferase